MKQPRAQHSPSGSEKSKVAGAALRAGLTPPGRNDDVPRGAQGPCLVTGGAGFVGANLAHRLLTNGYRVHILDTLARAGVAQNLRWLQATHGERVTFERSDVRDAPAVARAVAGAQAVFHLAAQAAVTTSFADPRYDFEVNVLGTLNVLEALRACREPPPLVVTSTNKVYGALPDVPLVASASRYEPADERLRTYGVGETRPLDLHSPYGCSKGAADQYVIDYARSFNLPAVCFRVSCSYGPHQFGTEDQGWVAHFLSRALAGRPITLYGDGKQVRDVLFVEDLVDALLLAWGHARRLRGRAFNIGGGPEHTTSLLELLDTIEELHGGRPELELGDWRTGDQRYYVSDTRAFREATGWTARVGVEEGVSRLHQWLVAAGQNANGAAKRMAQ